MEVEEEECTAVKNPPKFSCDICGNEYASRNSYDRHRQAHFGEKPFRCSVCPEEFYECFRLNLHKRCHEGNLGVNCADCGATFSSRNDKFKLHQQVHLPGYEEYWRNLHPDVQTPIPCGICGQLCKSINGLKQHQMVHQEELKLYTCEICKAKFRSAVAFKLHKNIHNGVKPFECKTCHKTFVRSLELRYHRFLHTADKGRGVQDMVSDVTADSSRDHHTSLTLKGDVKNTSNSNKKYSKHCATNLDFEQISDVRKEKSRRNCKVCNTDFKCKRDYKTHDCVSCSNKKPEETRKKTYSCTTCSSEFNHKRDLRAHRVECFQKLKEEVPERPLFTCRICQLTFDILEDFKNHACLHYMKTQEKDSKQKVTCAELQTAQRCLPFESNRHSDQQPKKKIKKQLYSCKDCGGDVSSESIHDCPAEKSLKNEVENQVSSSKDQDLMIKSTSDLKRKKQKQKQGNLKKKVRQLENQFSYSKN